MAAKTVQGLDQIIHSCVPVCVMDADGNIRFVNGSFKTLFHIEEDVCGQVFYAVLGLKESDVELFHGCPDQGSLLEKEVTRDGFAPVRCVIRAIPMAPHETVPSSDVVLLFTDVTGLVRPDTERDDLTARLNKATGELTEFTCIISHDLKAPLRGIKTISDWISTDYGEQLGAEGKAQMDLLVNRVDRLQSLIEGVLQYSRIGRMTECIVPLDLNTLLPCTVESVTCPDTIQVVIQEDLPTVYGEPTRIRQVFENLLGNAVRFMDKPEGQIQVMCQDAGEFWHFSVTDNGPGIDSQYFEKIFKMFQTLVPRDEFESAGVGLTLVKKIVDINNGRVWVESNVGQGSTFHFTYPKTLGSPAYQAE